MEAGERVDDFPYLYGVSQWLTVPTPYWILRSFFDFGVRER
jgi:hypothetical protein